MAPPDDSRHGGHFAIAMSAQRHIYAHPMGLEPSTAACVTPWLCSVPVTIGRVERVDRDGVPDRWGPGEKKVEGVGTAEVGLGRVRSRPQCS